MLDRPSIVCRVVRPILSPIVAAPGDVLAAWPGHPSHTLAVAPPDLSRIIRHRFCEDGVLYGVLLDLFLDARISLPVRSQKALLTSYQE